MPSADSLPGQEPSTAAVEQGPGPEHGRLATQLSPAPNAHTPEAIARWAERQQTDTSSASPKYKRLTFEQTRTARQLQKLGKTQTEIAQVLGCSQPAVCRTLQAFEDTSEDAILYSRGKALDLVQRVVRRGRPADHIALLKGVGVLKDDSKPSTLIQIGSADHVLVSKA